MGLLMGLGKGLIGAWDGTYQGLGWGLSGLGMGVLLGFLYINKFDFVG